jgi:hypothetical protein
VLAGDRTGGDGEFAADRRLLARDLPAGLTVEVEDAAGVVVELAAGVGEFDLPAEAAEQQHSEFALERPDALADGGLGEFERGRRR